MTPLKVLILPPSEEHRETLGNLVDWPVKLRRVIVNPSLVEPELRICVECLVLVKAAADGRRIVRLPYPEGAEPEPDPWLLGLDALIEPFDKGIYCLPAPVGARKLPA